MEIQLTYYGRLAEITGKTTETLQIPTNSVQGIKDTLGKQYPLLSEMTYTLAAHHSLLKDEDMVTASQIDVFPPFSGG